MFAYKSNFSNPSIEKEPKNHPMYNKIKKYSQFQPHHVDRFYNDDFDVYTHKYPKNSTNCTNSNFFLNDRPRNKCGQNLKCGNNKSFKCQNKKPKYNNFGCVNTCNNVCNRPVRCNNKCFNQFPACDFNTCQPRCNVGCKVDLKLDCDVNVDVKFPKPCFPKTCNPCNFGNCC